MALHDYDDLVTFWKLNGQAGLVRIINNGLGHMMMRSMNLLARNAFLSNTFAMYGANGTSFNSVTSGDKISTRLIHDIHLGMSEREVPYTRNPDGSAPFGNIICITTPGVLSDLRNEVANNSKGIEFINAMSYANATQLISGEVGTYAGVRFVQTNDACLYNAGEIDVQASIGAAVAAGDGAPDSASTAVDGAYFVGQPGAQATHYIAVDDVTGFEVGRRVTIHVDRTSAFGITNGVDYRDGKATTRRIVSIDVGNNRLVFDEPLMEDFSTDLGGGVYGYVTQGRNIHATTFIGGTDGVVAGNLRAPEVRVIDPVDDFKAMYRVSWSGRFGYQVFEPHVFENVFLAGSNREIGARYNS